SSLGFDSNNFRFTKMHEDIERYLERSGVAWTHLRPSQFMQIYFRELKTIVAEGAMYFAMDGARLSPVDIEDVAKVAHAILRDGGHEGERLDMTGPEALAMADVAERISGAVGRMIRYVNVTPEEKKAAMLKAGMPVGQVDALDELFAERRRHPESRVYLNT